MSRVNNYIFIPTKGKDENKFKRIPAFEKVSKTLFKEVASGFRMSGKVKEFIQQHQLAVHCYGSDFNGYGYSTDNYEFLLHPKEAKTVLQMLEDRTVASNKRKTPSKADQKTAWCRRLSKLTGITLEVAKSIADEKIEAKWQQIAELERRQDTQRYSIKREKLIRKVERSNPLRRIKDRDHAFAILQASVRHNSSDYDAVLEEAREMAVWGDLDRSQVKDYAREHASYWSDIQSTFFSEDDEDDLEIE